MSALNLRKIAEGTYVDPREVVAVVVRSLTVLKGGRIEAAPADQCRVVIFLSSGAELKVDRPREGLNTWLRTALDARGVERE